MSTAVDVIAPSPSSDREWSFSLERTAPLFSALIVLAVGIALIDSLPVGVVHDDGMYVVLAKSLASGQGYRWIQVPGAPAATHYPPGYPALLALLWLVYPVFPANVMLFKFANACFAALAATACVRFARERFTMSSLGAGGFAIASILSIPMLTLSVMVMSEPFFLALVIPILIYAERVLDSDTARRRDIVFLGLAAGVATLVRTHGIALIAAMPLMLVAKRRRVGDAFLFVAAAVAMVLPWQLWAGANAAAVPAPMQGNYGSYGAWLFAGLHTEGLGLLWRTAARTSVELIAMFATLAAPSLPALPRIIALVALAILSIVGARVYGRRAPVSAVFLALYATIVIVWPFTPARFAWGVWPLVLILPVLGGREILRWRPSTQTLRFARIGGLSLTVALAMGHALYTVRGYRGRWWASIPRAGAANLRPLVLWAAQHTAPTDVLAVEAESAVYLYTGRQTVPVHTFTVQQYFNPRTAAQDAEVIDGVLAHYHVDAVAVTTRTIREATRLLATRTPPLLTLTDSFPGGIVLTPAHR